METMVYNLKVKKEVWEVFKEKHGSDFNISYRLNSWVQFFQDKEIFTTLNLDKISSDIGVAKVEGIKGTVKYNFSVNRSDWDNFKITSRTNKMSANYALNKMIRKYINEGALMSKTIEL